MTYTREQILHTAKLLQPQLAKLPDLNLELQTLISQAEKGQPVEDDILSLLASNDRLREEALKLLSTDEKNGTKSASLPGNPTAIASTLRYECLECSKSLKSPQLGIIPKCPDHPNANIKAI
ncbi:MAG: hypothetical protein LH631_11580 [Alkalinema sp. CAN_BIN05]|nr:hypothetical protein [Alkalinema sp. CAN_BIN05]